MLVSAACECWLVVRQAEGLSPRTLRWYGDQVGRLVDYLGPGRRLADVTLQDLAGWLTWERGRGLAPASVDACYRAARAWLRWCVERGLVSVSPMAGLRRPRVGRPVVRRATVDEYRRVVSSITDETWLDWRDRALLALLMWSGLRLAELVDLKVADLDLRGGLVLVRRGKGGRARLVPVVDGLRELVLNYLYGRPAWGGPELWLAADSNGRGVRVLGGEGIRQMLKRRCRRAGVAYRNPHAWRHGFAVSLLNAGAELSAVSAMMGHASVSITSDVYARWETGGLQREYRAAVRTFDYRSDGARAV